MSNKSIVERMTGMTSLGELKKYYLYSLMPNKVELCFLFGREIGERYYQQALIEPKQPTLSEFIRYVKAFKKRNPNMIIIHHIHEKQSAKTNKS